MKSWKLWVLGVLALAGVILGVDYRLAVARLDSVVIATSIEPPQAVADGHSSVVITFRVTEDGDPRGNDLVQAWLGRGAGLLTPNWIVTDERGMARITYTPNPYSPYDPQDAAEIHISDTSIGRLVEVEKLHVARVPLIDPDQP